MTKNKIHRVFLLTKRLILKDINLVSNARRYYYNRAAWVVRKKFLT